MEPSSNFVAYSNGQVTAAEAGRDGTHYAATNTTVSGGGFYQDITETINPGETYCASAFVRSQYGGTASGSMALWLIGGTGQDSAGTGYSHLGTLNNWTPIESCVTATTAHTTLRVQFYPTPNGGTTDVDDISSYLAPSIQAVARQQPPVISGTPRVGTQLSATAGTWSPSGASYTYQWRANDKDITGATKSTYKPGPAMVGKTISVRVTASEAGYQPASATSAETQSVAKGVTRCVTAPKVSGTTGVGSTLTASTGAWKPGELTYHYQWLRNGTPIAKATGRTYKLKAADKNHWIRVQVTATRTGWTTVSRTSASTARIRG